MLAFIFTSTLNLHSSLVVDDFDISWGVLLSIPRYQLKFYSLYFLLKWYKERNALLYTLHSLGDRGPNSLEKGSKEDF